MTVSYAQYFSEHEVATWIINEENQRVYLFDNGAITESDFDPRDTVNDEHGEYGFDSCVTSAIGDLSLTDGEIKAIEQFINSGFATGSYEVHTDEEVSQAITKSKNSATSLFWAHYQKLNGKLITTFEEYEYYFDLFYKLTQNRVGGECPVPSDIGFELFGKIIKAMCKDSERKLNSTVEFNVFFRSVDEIHAYS